MTTDTILTLAEVRNGTGFEPGTRFLVIPPEPPSYPLADWYARTKGPLTMKLDSLALSGVNAITGKTVASVSVQSMTARDTYKDTVYLTQTTITFTDGSVVTFGEIETELFDLEPA